MEAKIYQNYAGIENISQKLVNLQTQKRIK